MSGTTIIGAARGVLLPLATLLALTGCGDPSPRPPVAGQEARAGLDVATAAYAECVEAAAKRLTSPESQAAQIATAALKECAAERTELKRLVRVFRQSGSPKDTPEYLDAVAEQSVIAVEGDLRGRAVVTAVSTQLEQAKQN